MAKDPGTESIVSMFEKIGKEMKIPGMDFEQVIAANRKNLAALEKSAKSATKGAGDMVNRQRQMLEETMNDFADAAKSLAASADPQDLMARQSEFVRQAFEKAMRNAGEAARMAQDTSTDVINTWRARFDEGVKELRDEIKKRSG